MKAQRLIAKNLLKFGAFFLLFSCSDATETESTPTVEPATAIETDISEIEATFDSLTSITGKKNLGIITIKGSPVALGDGYVKSWFTINLKTKLPEALGVEMSKTALNNLPTPPAGNHTSLTYVFFDPIAKLLTPYDHFAISWESQGHAAPPIYGTTFMVPHIDFHLFTIPYEEQQAIASWDSSNPSNPTNLLFNNFPATCFLPGNYFIVPLAVNPAAGNYGKFGKHWLPIINNPPASPLTYNLTYGTYNGKVDFVEIKAAYSSLSQQQDFQSDFSQPLKFQKTRFYPTKYKISHDNSTGKIYITLTHFVLRKASTACN